MNVLNRLFYISFSKFKNVPLANFVMSSNNILPITRLAFVENKIPKLNSVQSIQFRHYAKSKDKKKQKDKVKVEINDSQISEFINLESAKTQLQKAVDTLKDDFAKHLSIRSTAGSVESIQVVIDGRSHTLQEVAQIVRKNPKMIVVNMAIFPQAIPAALKAIQKSGMNINPQQDGTTLYLPVPIVTKEHRENLAKNAKSLFTKCKDHIRDVQNKHLKSLKKKGNVSEDVIHNVEQQIIALANQYVSQAEKTLENKQKELVGQD